MINERLLPYPPLHAEAPLRWRPETLSTHRRRITGRQALLGLAALLTVGPWAGLLAKAPALHWTAQPLPFGDIRQAAWTIGPLSDTVILLFLLLAGYVLLVSVLEASPTDPPAWFILGVPCIAGLMAMFTYALFAEDVNFLLANLWTYTIHNENPYSVAAIELPGNPFARFTSWADFEYLYGPIVLPAGSLLIHLFGSNVVAAVLGVKLVLLVVLWLTGGLTWLLARAAGSPRPMFTVALILWNPLLLAESVMTPHLDLLMASFFLLAALAWSIRLEGGAVILLGISVGVKLVTAMLLPAVLLSLAIGIWRRGWTRAHRPLLALTALAVVAVGLWPEVWSPLMDNGLRKELEEQSMAALLPNLIEVAQAIRAIPGGEQWDVDAAARSWRWFLFVPFWLIGTALCVTVAWRHRHPTPTVLFPALAVIMLGYHALFTLVVLPWHFITAICLCLASDSPTARRAGMLITASGMLFHINDRWVWTHPWSDPAAVSWVLGASLLAGPLLSLAMLAHETITSCRGRRYRRAAIAQSAHPLIGTWRHAW